MCICHYKVIMFMARMLAGSGACISLLSSGPLALLWHPASCSSAHLLASPRLWALVPRLPAEAEGALSSNPAGHLLPV